MFSPASKCTLRSAHIPPVGCGLNWFIRSMGGTPLAWTCLSSSHPTFPFGSRTLLTTVVPSDILMPYRSHCLADREPLQCCIIQRHAIPVHVVGLNVANCSS
ncbi:unnamed protein product, partial [Ectocarpus sp. 8 AP-2014]